MNIYVVFLFFIYIYGLGHSIMRFQPKLDAERIIIRLGVGLAALVVLGYLLNFFRIPLDWRVVLVCSLSLPLYDYFRAKQVLSVSSLCACFKLDTGSIVVGLVFLGCVLLYCGGPFCYPWLEDTDPWHHASAIKYITLTKTLNAENGLFQYMNPYPPGYDWVMAVLHQTSRSLYWTLKFFNGLIVALGFLFFYLFVKEFSKDRSKARYAMYFLACIPCYLSHFIWAHALTVTLFFPAFYLILKSAKNSKYVLPGSIVVAAIFLTQPTQSIKFIFLILILLCAMWFWKRTGKIRIFIILFLAACISFVLWWGPVIYKIAKGESSLVVASQHTITGTDQKEFKNAASLKKRISKVFNPKGGTATEPYNLSHYLIPKKNKINNPVGIGLFLMILSFLGLIIAWFQFVREKDEQKRIYYTTLFGWLLFTFLGLNSETFSLPFGLFAFRFWMLLAIPVTMLAAECLFFIKAGRYSWRKTLILAVACLLVFIGSATKKIISQTKRWPPGKQWGSVLEAEGYAWLRNHLPRNTKVFAFKNNFVVNGLDMLSDFWDTGQRRDVQGIFDKDIVQLHGILKKHGYQYLVIGAKEAVHFGGDHVKRKVEDLKQSGLFEFQYEHKRAVSFFKIL